MNISNLTHRQKLLYGAITLIGVLYAGDIGYRKLYQAPIADTERQVAGLRDRLRKQKLANAKANRAGDEVEVLQQVSLPRNLELARSSYQAWLLQLVQECQLNSPKVDSGDPTTLAYRRELLYHKFVFTVRSRGNLRQITQLLHDFYAAGHLHKIQSLSLTPNSVSNQLDIALSIEALSLPGADRESDLSMQISDRLASAELADYRGIASRDLFQVGGDRLGRQVHLSAIISDRLGQREAWFYNQRDDNTHRLKLTETLMFGTLTADLKEINDQSVVIMIDDRTWLLPIGSTLAEATPYPATTVAKGRFEPQK